MPWGLTDVTSSVSTFHAVPTDDLEVNMNPSGKYWECLNILPSSLSSDT
jgi:hypothetical protein